MANLAVSTTTRGGLEPDDTATACAAGGDAFTNDGATLLYFKNGGVATRTITIATQIAPDGFATADRTITLLSGDRVIAGPFPPGVYNDANGKVQLTYDAVTSLVCLPFKVGT